MHFLAADVFSCGEKALLRLGGTALHRQQQMQPIHEQRRKP
jgi:hypothetical protein